MLKQDLGGVICSDGSKCYNVDSAASNHNSMISIWTPRDSRVLPVSA